MLQKSFSDFHKDVAQQKLLLEKNKKKKGDDGRDARKGRVAHSQNKM